MQHWNDRLKLGKGSRFIKRDLRLLPLTEAEFEADSRCKSWNAETAFYGRLIRASRQRMGVVLGLVWRLRDDDGGRSDGTC
jgi:hypothetical protein